MQSKKTISNLKQENELLVARIKQLQTGIDQCSKHVNKQNDMSAEANIFPVEKIIDQKKKTAHGFIKFAGKDMVQKMIRGKRNQI